MSELLITGATVLDGSAADVLVRDGVIAEIGSVDAPASAERVEADGLTLLPGLVDLPPIADVHSGPERTPPDLRGRRPGRLLVQIGDHDAIPAVGQQARDISAQAATVPGHERAADPRRRHFPSFSPARISP